jgi:hypothetical protein
MPVKESKVQTAFRGTFQDTLRHSLTFLETVQQELKMAVPEGEQFVLQAELNKTFTMN